MTIKRFDFVVNVEVYATRKNEAEKIMDKIKNENEFPDGSIIDSDVQFASWQHYDEVIVKRVKN